MKPRPLLPNAHFEALLVDEFSVHQQNVTDLRSYLRYLAKYPKEPKYIKYVKSNELGQVGWVDLAKSLNLAKSTKSSFKLFFKLSTKSVLRVYLAC